MTQLYKICHDNTYSNNFRNYFALDYSDSIIVYCLTPLSLLCAILNVYFFYKFPNAREPPFDILLVITVLSVLNVAVYLSTVAIVYNQQYPIAQPNPNTLPDSFNNFCLVTGTMRFMAELGVMVYNTVFCLYYTCKIKNPLRTWVRDNKEIHGLCFVLVVIGTVVIYVSSQIGVSVLGVCGLKVAKSSVFIQLAILVIYAAVLVTTSIFFLKYLSRISRFDTKAKLFFKYYLLYTLLISLVYLLQCGVMIFIIVDCFTGISASTYDKYAKTGNILVLITPLISTVIIGFHPEFGKKFIPQFFKICQKKNTEERASFYESMITTTNRNSLQNSVMIQLPEMNTQNKGYLSSIKQFNRLSLLSTILGCISLMSSRRKNSSAMQNRASIGSSETDHIFSWNFSDEYEVMVEEGIVEGNKEYFVENIPAAMIRFVSHSMSVFEALMDQDRLEMLEYSTNPNRNLNKIYKNAQADGGSSGQFFFFTHDNRILLKTITNRELQVLMERLQAYYHYLNNNPESLIVKIYGVFSAINPETNQRLHFMMMGNLCEDINRKYVLRIYDCKGSSLHREVFKERKQQQEPQYSKKTMKDVDFERLEHKVWVKQETSQKIKQVLRSDSLFFLQNGLIDYSLIIIKIDYNAYCLDMGGKKPTFNQRTMFFNCKETNMVYILGIIDYLETWNVKKKGERWYKSIFNRSDTISSQSPNFYSQRFCENLIQKIFI